MTAFGMWGLLDLRTLTVRPSDVTGAPLGASSSVAGVTVTAEYDRVVETDNGTRVEPGVRTPLTRDPANGWWSIGLLPADDPRIVTGEGVCVIIRVETLSRHGRGSGGHGTTGRVLGSKTIQMHVSDAPMTNISDKEPMTPVPVASLNVSPQQVNDAAANASAALDLATASATSAASAQTAAEDAADRAEAAEAAAYATPDSGTATLIKNTNSQTRQALEAIFVSTGPVYVDSFKEPGDPDDGAAFRRAAAASDHVLLKEREYIVSPVASAAGSRKVVPMSHKVVWQGPGRDVCTVKMAPNSGDYHFTFGPDTGGSNFDASILADVGGSSWSGFTIDQNAADNPVTSYDQQLKKDANGVFRGRVGVAAFAGTDVRVEDMRFRDFHSIWCVQLLGQNLFKAGVARTDFVDIGHDTVNWDHTSIYLDAGSGGFVDDCNFWAREHAARQPFELHGANMNATGNKVYGYVYGGDVTGSIWHGPGGGAVHHNDFIGVASGLDIWTGPNYGVPGQYGIDGLKWSYNRVVVDHQRWAGKWYCGMVTLNGGASLPMRDVDISHNSYRLASLGSPASIDQVSQVVSMFRNVTPTAVEGGSNFDVGIRVRYNDAYGSVAGFMRYNNPGAGLDGFSLIGNTGRNLGRGGSSVYNNVANSTLLVETPQLWNSRSEKNDFDDSYTPRGIQRGSYYVVPTLRNVFDDGARVTTADNANLTLVSTTATSGAVMWRGSVPRFAPAAHPAGAAGVQKFLPGSQVTDEATGKTWKQVGSSGVSWVEVV